VEVSAESARPPGWGSFGRLSRADENETDWDDSHKEVIDIKIHPARPSRIRAFCRSATAAILAALNLLGLALS
jgi:hypothetical protein